MEINKKIKEQKGFFSLDAFLGIAVFLILSAAVIAIVLNINSTYISMHHSSQATDYAVEILENAKLLNYYDNKLKQGTYNENELLGVKMTQGFTADFKVTDYNKTEGNLGKQDLIKILELTINYTEGSLNKNVKFSTLKINNNI